MVGQKFLEGLLEPLLFLNNHRESLISQKDVGLIIVVVMVSPSLLHL